MDFNFDEKASDSKKRLEEAKARLLEEKRRFKEEMHAARSHGYSGEPVLKPWMIWDISLFIIMIILFSVAMYYPRTGTELTSAAVVSNQTPTQTTAPSITGSSVLVVENISSGVTSSAEEEEEIEGPPPKFSLILEDTDGNSIDEIKTDADNLEYNVVIKNLEKDFIFCNGDRTIDNDIDEDYYLNLKVHPFETEELPNTLLGSGRVEVKYDFSCRFADGTRYSKLSSEFDAIFE